MSGINGISPYIHNKAIDTPIVYSIADILQMSDTEKIKDFIAKTGGTELPALKSLFDYLITTDNDYSTTGSTDFTSEGLLFEIADDTRYELTNPWIDLTPFTAADVVTIQMYRSVAAAGATYRKAGSPISFTVDTDNPIVELSDVAHYGYIKFVATSVPTRTVDVPFGYIKKPLE